MMKSVEWVEGNERFLAAALAWLRLRLDALRLTNEPPPPEPPAPPRRGWLGRLIDRLFRRRKSEGPIVSAEELWRQRQRDAWWAADDARSQMNKACDKGLPPALSILAASLDRLTFFEQDVLLLCAAVELDPDLARRVAAVQPDRSEYPTFYLARLLFDGFSWDAMAPESPLRLHRLIEINQPANRPLATSGLRADERIVNYLKGLNFLDDRVAPLMKFVPPAEDGLSRSQQEAAATVLRAWPRGRRLPSTTVIQLIGPDENAQRAVAAYAAAERKHALYRMSPEALPAHPGDLETLARLWDRERRLLPLALYIDAHDAESRPAAENAPPAAFPPPQLVRFLDRSGGLIFVAGREAAGRSIGESTRIDVPRATADEQAQAWVAALGPAAADATRLAGQFDLSLADIRRAAADAAAPLPSGEPPMPLTERLWAACRAAARPRLDALAQRIDAKAAWPDLVLPDEPSRLLRQIAAQVDRRGVVLQDWGFGDRMNRGTGITALFVGESGTGKSMAAEVLANHLKLDLYRIDLSAVVNKYIGETEKNLRRLFDAADAGGAILLFDEADALFGKRSEVKDSHDRYANVEVNYLLQRLEAYRGLAILATNMRSALDTAFLRRLRFVVTLPRPARAQRKQMWQNAFPGWMPWPQLDYDRLAGLDLTGGNIHSIAVNAAFAAAATKEQAVTMELVLRAARDEFVKLERPVNAADFAWPPPAAPDAAQAILSQKGAA